MMESNAPLDSSIPMAVPTDAAREDSAPAAAMAREMAAVLIAAAPRPHTARSTTADDTKAAGEGAAGTTRPNTMFLNLWFNLF